MLIPPSYRSVVQLFLNYGYISAIALHVIHLMCILCIGSSAFDIAIMLTVIKLSSLTQCSF